MAIDWSAGWPRVKREDVAQDGDGQYYVIGSDNRQDGNGESIGRLYINRDDIYRAVNWRDLQAEGLWSSVLDFEGPLWSKALHPNVPRSYYDDPTRKAQAILEISGLDPYQTGHIDQQNVNEWKEALIAGRIPYSTLAGTLTARQQSAADMDLFDYLDAGITMALEVIVKAGLTMGFGALASSTVGAASTATAAETSAETVASAESLAEAKTAADQASFLQLENHFQDTTNMDIWGAGEFGSENALPTRDLFAFDSSSLMTPETFVDNFDMLPDPTIVYQTPEIIQMNPLPGFFERATNLVIDKGIPYAINRILSPDDNTLPARAPSNPIANQTPTRASAAGTTLREYYNTAVQGGTNWVVLAVGGALLMLVVGALIGRK